MPVTITSRMFYLLLKFSQKFHFRFKCHSKFSIYNLCYMLHQARTSSAVASPVLITKPQCFSDTWAPPTRYPRQSAVHDQFAGKISFRSFKCTSSTWVFQRLFRCTLLTELSGQLFISSRLPSLRESTAPRTIYPAVFMMLVLYPI